MPKFQEGTVNDSASPVSIKAEAYVETLIVPAASGRADKTTANPNRRR